LRVAPSPWPRRDLRREVRAGVERIRENIFDWVRLPVPHDMYFNAVELMEIGNCGWRVELTEFSENPIKR
jgi:hypothetical protein